MSTTLRDGTTVEDHRLDRLIQFDERSRDYPVMATISAKKPRSYHWRCEQTLDQGREGACVGFAWTHELVARPREMRLSDAYAIEVYKEAQKIDQWPGEDYSGTSVIAGVQILQQRGLIGEYRWAFGIHDLVMAVGYKGPAVLGIPWHQGMYRPRLAGNGSYWIDLSGPKVGGHAIVARGCKIVWKRGMSWAQRGWQDHGWDAVDMEKSFVTLRNSWGMGWGDGGDARITLAHLALLLGDRGEACIPVERR